MLALGIAASLAVNVAQGWSHEVVGAVVAAWPAVALVGSCELLAWMIRTAAARQADHVPEADRRVPPAAQPEARLQPAVPLLRESGRAATPISGASRLSGGAPGLHRLVRPVALVRGPGSNAPEQPDQVGERCRDVPGRADHVDGSQRPGAVSAVSSIKVAAVAAYRASVREGKRLSERRLAETFGMTSRRWARHRMAEARGSLALGAPQPVAQEVEA